MKSKICTTIDQCKKLLELGIDINTADLTVTNLPLQDGSRFNFICCKLPNDTFPSITDGKSEKIPGWSLSALLKLMPKIILNENDAPWQPNLSKGYYNNLWQCVYCSDIHITEWYEDPLDAAFEMVCWLKENNKI